MRLHSQNAAFIGEDNPRAIKIQEWGGVTTILLIMDWKQEGSLRLLSLVISWYEAGNEPEPMTEWKEDSRMDRVKTAVSNLFVNYSEIATLHSILAD